MSIGEVRLRYSVIVNYTASLYRILVGIGFLVIIARKLSLQEFGLWGIIFIVSNILAWPVRLWVYWAQRHVVYELKDKDSKYKNTIPTALALTTIYSTVSICVFLAIGYAYNIVLGYGFNYFLVAIPFMVSMEYITLLEDLSVTLRPEQVGFSNFLLDTVRIVLTYLLVAYLRMGLYGVLVAVFIARLTKIAYLTVKTILALRLHLGMYSVNWSLAKLWLKAYRIPLTMILSQNLDNADRSIAPVVTGNVEPVAYLNIAYTMRTPFASGLYVFMGGLYAKLLRSPRGEYVEEVLRLLLFPAIMLLSIILALPKPIVSLLNPKYLEASILLIPASIAFTLYNIELILLGAIMGSEQFDRVAGNMENYASTLTYRVMTLRLTRSIMVLVTASMLAYLATNPLDQATIFVLARLIGFLVPTIILYSYARRLLEFNFPKKELVEFTIAGILAYTTVTLLGGSNTVHTTFTAQLVAFIEYSVIAILVYSATAIALSKWLRNLIRRALSMYLPLTRKPKKTI